MKTIILAEPQLSSSTLNQGTSAAISMAKSLGGENITVVYIGDSSIDLPVELTNNQDISGIDALDISKYQDKITAEPLAEWLAKNYDDAANFIAPSTSFAKDICPRLAALWNVDALTDVVAMVDSQTFIRPIYAGNAWQTLTYSGPKRIFTIRTAPFLSNKDAITDKTKDIPIKWFNAKDVLSANWPSCISSTNKDDNQVIDLTQASTVVSGGRGVGGVDGFKLIEDLASVLGAAVGASRAVVDNGDVPNDYQVGQTGKIVAPDLYIAIGISGAIQHIAGIKDSKVIAAINNDEQAPIFDVADIGYVGDFSAAVPELIDKIKDIKSK